MNGANGGGMATEVRRANSGGGGGNTGAPPSLACEGGALAFEGAGLAFLKKDFNPKPLVERRSRVLCRRVMHGSEI